MPKSNYIKHDMTYCDNEKCTRKDDCARYVSLMNLRESRAGYIVSVLSNERDISDCEFYKYIDENIREH